MFRVFSIQSGRLKKLSLAKRFLLGVLAIPFIVLTIPLVIFFIYRSLKTAKKIQEEMQKPETLRVKGEIIDIEPSTTSSSYRSIHLKN